MSIKISTTDHYVYLRTLIRVWISSGVVAAIMLFGDLSAYGTTIDTGQTVLTSGVSGAITFNGGTLRANATGPLANQITVSSGGGTINTYGYRLNLHGGVTGSNNLTVQNTTGTGSIIFGTGGHSGNAYSFSALVYTGNLTIASGTVVGNLSNAASITIGTSGTYDIGGSGKSIRNLSGSGTITNNGNGNGTGGGSTANISLANTANVSFGGVIQDGSKATNLVINAGSCTQTLTGLNTYSGSTTIKSGTLNVNNTAIPSGSAITLGNSIVTPNTSGTLQAGANLSLINTITLAYDSTIDTNDYSMTASGGVSGDYALTKIGSGTLTLTGTNSGSGTTTVSAGALNISATNNLGSGGITLGGGTLQAGASFTLSQAITLSANSTIDTNDYSMTASGGVSGNYALTKIGSGTLTLTGTYSGSGTTTVSGGTLNISASSKLGSGAITLDGGILQAGASLSLSNTITLSANSTIDTNDYSMTVSGGVSGNYALTKIGSGTLTITGTNSGSGTTTVGVGTLNISASNKLGSGGITLGGGTLQAGASFTLSQAITLSANSTIDPNGYTVTLAGAPTLNGHTLTILNPVSQYTQTLYANQSGTIDLSSLGAYSNISALPLGLTLSGTTITGIPTTPGIYSIVYDTTGGTTGAVMSGGGTIAGAAYRNTFTLTVKGNLLYKNLYTDVFSNAYTSTPSPVDMTMDGSGNVYVLDSEGGGSVYKIGQSGAIFTPTDTPQGIVYNPYDGKIYVSANNGGDGKVTPYEYSSDSWSAGTAILSSSLSSPQGMCCDRSGNVYVADANYSLICKISTGGSVTVIAGPDSPEPGYTDANGTSARFYHPYGVAIDPTGTYLYVADTENNLIRSINLITQSDGVNTYPVTTLAGNYAYNNGTGPGNIDLPHGQGYADGVGAAALFSTPKRLICDSDGNIFVTDNGNGVIRKITKYGVVTTIAGAVKTDNITYPSPFTPGMDLFAQFSPLALALNPTTGVIYVADQSNACIESITPNYIAPYVAVNVSTNSDFGTYPITFAGGALVLQDNVTFSNPINLSAPSLVVGNGYNLTLTGSLNSGTSNLNQYSGGTVDWVHGSTSYDSTYVKSSLSPTDGILVDTGGTLTITADTTVGAPTIYVMSGGTIKFNAGSISIYNNICLIGNGTIDANAHNPNLYGVMGGPRGVTFQSTGSAGTITLNAVCTYTGSTTISSGTTLSANRANAIAASSSVNVNGTFNLSGNVQLLNDVNGAGTITDSNVGDALTLNSITRSTFAGTLDTSLGGITVIEPEVLTLTETNSTVNGLSIGGTLNGIAVGGILKVSSATALGTGTINFNEGGILQAGNGITLASEQPVTLNGNAIIDCFGNTVNMSGCPISNENHFCISAIGGGALTLPEEYAAPVVRSGTTVSGVSATTLLTSANNTTTGDTIILSSTISTSDSTAFSTGTVFFYGSGSIQASAPLLTIPNPIMMATQGTLDANSYALTVTGPITGNQGLTVKSTNTAGTVALLGNNTHTGGTTVNSGAVLQIYDTMNVGTGVVTMNGGTVQAACDLTIPNTISVAANSTLDANGYALTVTDAISGTYGLTIRSNTAGGTVALLGSNTNSGGITVNSGVLLQIYKSANVGSGTVTIESGGAIQAVGNVTITRPLVFGSAS